MSGSNGLLESIAHPAQVNLLDLYGKAAQTGNSIWENRLAQARQLSGQAQQDATAADGTYSPDQYRANLKNAGPDAALAAQSGMASNQQLSSDQLEQAFKKTGWVAKTSAGALADPKFDYSDASMMKLIGQGSADGVLTMPEILKQLQTMPADAAGRRQWLEQHQAQALSQEQQLNLRYGTPAMPDTGGQKVPGMVDPRTGAFTPAGAPLTRTLTPGEKITTQEAVDGATGAKGTVPVGSKYNDDGSLKPPGWGNNGKYGAKSADGATKPAGFTPTEQAPGMAESQRGAAEASTRAGTKIYADADVATGMKSQLLTMEGDLAKISTGPTSERAATVNAFLRKYHLPATMTADELAGSEAFAKVAKQIALAQAGALGAGTDEKLTTSLGANPNRDLSKMGNEQIIAMLQGNADAIKARGVAYDKWKQTHSGGDTNSFLTEFNKTFDPRVYQWNYQIKNMNQDQRTAAFNALPDKAEFRKKYNEAVKQGLISNGQ